MAKARSIFDVIGPVMIGPSSSHTAGAVRLGALAQAILGSTPASVIIKLHGSFASTGQGHGTEFALVAGLLGMNVDDERIPQAFDVAAENGMEFYFETIELEDVHPNTACFLMRSAEGNELMVRGSSVGGGAVIVDRIGSYEVELRGDYPSLVVSYTDQPGQISRISGVFADADINIASMRVSREHKGAGALMVIESDTPVDATTLMRVRKQPSVQDVRVVPKI